MVIDEMELIWDNVIAVCGTESYMLFLFLFYFLFILFPFWLHVRQLVVADASYGLRQLEIMTA